MSHSFMSAVFVSLLEMAIPQANAERFRRFL